MKRLFCLLLCVGLLGCAAEREKIADQSAEQLYNTAYNYAEEGDYKKAATYFDEVERQHPYSPWATRAQIMEAYTYYQHNRYTDAVNTLDRFLSLHPGHKDADYALYLKGMCYYEQISDVQRDQDMSAQAETTFHRLIMLYPETDYAKDALNKLRLTRNNIAGKEMQIGRYYQQRGRYGAALNRFSDVVRNYQTSMHIQEALYRLTECYIALGMLPEAKRAAAVLGHNYPSSEWYAKAYALCKAHGV